MKLAFLPAAIALSLVTLPALADDDRHCKHYPKEERMPVLEVQKKLNDQGYIIRDFDYDNGCFEVDVTDQNGRRSKLYLDASTGEPAQRSQRRDDDDDWDD